MRFNSNIACGSVVYSPLSLWWVINFLFVIKSLLVAQVDVFVFNLAHRTNICPHLYTWNSLMKQNAGILCMIHVCTMYTHRLLPWAHGDEMKRRWDAWYEQYTLQESKQHVILMLCQYLCVFPGSLHSENAPWMLQLIDFSIEHIACGEYHLVSIYRISSIKRRGY